jgi:hypothetical protein
MALFATDEICNQYLAGRAASHFRLCGLRLFSGIDTPRRNLWRVTNNVSRTDAPHPPSPLPTNSTFMCAIASRFSCQLE